MDLTHIVEKPTTPILFLAVFLLVDFASLFFLWIELGMNGVLLGLATTSLIFVIVYAFIVQVAKFEGIPPIRLVYSFPDTMFFLLIFLLAISFGLLEYESWIVFTFSVFTTLLLFQVLLDKQCTQVRIDGENIEIKSHLPFMSSEFELEIPIQYLILKPVGKRNFGNFEIVFENAVDGKNIFLYFTIQTSKHSFAIQVASNVQPDQIDQIVSLFPDSVRVIPSSALMDNGSGILKV